MFDIISIGSVIRDIIFKTKESKIPTRGYEGIKKQPLICFRYGVKIDPDQAFFTMGGGANNTAMGFARLGLKTGIFSKIGQDGTGQLVLGTLKKDKVDTSLVEIDKDLHTALSFIIVGRYNERTAFPYAGASGNMEVSKTEEKNLVKTKWFYITSLRRKSQRILPKLAKIIKKYKIKLAFNPGSTELGKGLFYLKDILKNTEVLLLNKEEASELVPSKKQAKNDIFCLLSALKKFGPKVVVITDGGNGAWARKDEMVYHIPAYRGKIVEKTGAGDAFGTGFIAGLIRSNDIKEALKLGAINSLSVIGQFGSCRGLLTMPKAQNLIKKYSSKSKIKEYSI